MYDVGDDDRSEDFAELLADLVADATSPNPDVVLRMTPAVAGRLLDLLRAAYRETRHDGSLDADVIKALEEIDGQLRAGGHREVSDQ